MRISPVLPTFRLVGLLVPVVALLTMPARGQWVEPPGTGWAKLQVAHQDTRSRFDRQGKVTRFDTENGRAITSTVRLTGAVGLVQGLDAWADLPYHRLEFNDIQDSRLQTGFADPRVYLRVGPEMAGISNLPVAVALRGGVKFPVGEFSVDAEIIPLSEGQRDWELLLEMGKSLHPWPLYVAAWGGYRWREANRARATKPGNEWLFHASAGGSIGLFTWKLSVDALYGQPPERTDFGIVLENDRRELVQVLPTLGWRLGPGTLKSGARVPLHGRRFPAGPVFTLGYFWTWDSPLW